MMNVENIRLYILERLERSSRFYENNINFIWNGRFAAYMHGAPPWIKRPFPKFDSLQTKRCLKCFNHLSYYQSFFNI